MLLEKFNAKPLNSEVMTFIGEYLGEDKNKPIPDIGTGMWHYKVPDVKTAHCDRNLIKRVLDIYRGRFDGDVGYGVYNLITILKKVRVDLSGSDLHELDLRHCVLNGTSLGKPSCGSALRGAKVGHSELFPVGHVDEVLCSAVCPDCKHIVTASADKTAKVWDAETGSLDVTLYGHRKIISSIAFSSDGKYIFTASEDYTAKVWDAETGSLLMNLWIWDLFHLNDANLYSMNAESYNHEEKRNLNASENCNAEVWNTGTEVLLTYTNGCKEVVLLSRDGKYYVTAPDNNTVKMWDTKTGSLLTTIEENIISNVGFCCYRRNKTAYSPDGKHIVTVENCTAKVRDVETGSLMVILDCEYADINDIAYSPDGKYIITSSEDCSAKIWDAVTGSLNKTLKGYSVCFNNAMYSPNGRYIVTASEDNAVKVWDASTGSIIRILNIYPDHLFYAAYSQDGKYIIAELSDDIIKVWDALTGLPVKTPEGYTFDIDIDTISYSTDKKYYATTSLDPRDNDVWKMDALTHSLLLTFKGHKRYVNSVVFWQDKHVLTASADGTTKIWDAMTGDCLDTIPNIPGLEVIGCDLRNLHPDSDLSAKDRELLRRYGAIID